MPLLAKKDRSPTGRSERASDELASQEQKLLDEIQRLRDFVENEPDRLRQAEDEAARILPPMDDLDDRRRERSFYERYGRGEIKNERRKQQLSGFLIFLLISASVAMGYWVYLIIQQAIV
ncbi:hypothetical protein [Persicirhabdus sediminis]|uniref:Uncharacterized protein n=1 Tax=Persicirhabdus sediminis TaxID=454144 RepID=A0A8J7MBF9_9BACT|nr:hypothetical protein [Persicirhabdus sediminis]MBK1790479.1 hypothetical protein [Persicirhabdus sediminis]